MALVKCSECGREISTKAAACPGCGAPAATVFGATPTPAASLTPAIPPAGDGERNERRPANPAFMRPLQPNVFLAEIVGNQPIARTEVTKRMWVYIKKNGLQDPKDRRMINADEKLLPIFGGKTQVSMFDMITLVSACLK